MGEVCLLSADRVGHGAICTRGGVWMTGKAGVGRRLLLLLQQIVLPIILLPERVHAVERK